MGNNKCYNIFMRIISIGTDTKILDGGRVFERVKEYVSLVEGDYYTFVFGASGEKKENNFHAIGLGESNKLIQIYNLFKELKKINLNKNDILYPQDVFEIGLISYLISKIYTCKLYVQCHTDTSSENFRNESRRNYLQYLICKFVFKRADKIRVVSKRMENYLVEELAIKENKVLNLPIYFDGKKNLELESTSSSPEGGGREGDVDFLIMSRLEPVKNIKVAIDAVFLLRKKTAQDLTLKIVGEGSIKNKLIEKFNNESYNFVTWENWTNNPNQEYQNAKYFLFPSLYEGWGMTAVESVANGTPVIMTNVGCAHEFILDFENGIVANGFDKFAIQEAIEKAMGTDFSKEKMRQSVLRLNTKKEYLKKLKNFLNEMV